MRRREHRFWLPLALAACLVGSLSFLAGCQPHDSQQDVLLFEVEENGNTEVYRMDLDGKNRVNLTHHRAWDGTPAWSPDGQQIVFASDREGTPDLYVMQANGSGLRRLTDWDAAELMPVWSPDGTRIAFASDRAYEERRERGTVTVEAGLEIWVIRADGTQATRITGNPEDVGIYPTWSRDGKQIVYQNISTRSDIIATDLLNLFPRNLTEGFPGSHWSPTWSPQGDWILFTSDDGENKEIYRMDQTGGRVTCLTNHPAADADPAWSPDGKWIAFVSDRVGAPQIFLMDAEGQNLRQITQGQAAHARPAWRPVPTP